jgi:hypothetical protein
VLLGSNSARLYNNPALRLRPDFAGIFKRISIQNQQVTSHFFLNPAMTVALQNLSIP